jgi:hypothetical protein
MFYKASLREIMNISVSRLANTIFNKTSFEGKLRLTDDEFANMKIVRQAIANVIATGDLTPLRVQAAGLTPEMLDDAAEAEVRYADYSGIAPDMAEIDQRNRLQVHGGLEWLGGAEVRANVPADGDRTQGPAQAVRQRPPSS